MMSRIRCTTRIRGILPWRAARSFWNDATLNVNNLKNVTFSVRDSVAVLRINCEGKNVVTEALIEELSVAGKIIESDVNIRAAVVISGQPNCFLFGVDVGIIERSKSTEDAIQKSRGVHGWFFDIENSKKPYVAAIQGACLGGGLELAVACHYRMAVNDRATVFALPEVLLGLLPGGGGTQRLPKLVGIPTALEWMLTGKYVSTEKAKKAGLVDQIVVALGPGTKPNVTSDCLEDLAVKTAKDLAYGKLNPKKQKSPKEKLMSLALKLDIVKDRVFKKAEAQVMKKTKGLYPAPLRILKVVRKGLDGGPNIGYDAEATAFGELFSTPESKGLISLFRGQTECKKNRYGNPQKPVKNVAVLGAGLMGAGIVQVTAEKGFNVIMNDASIEGLQQGITQINKGFEKLQKQKKINVLEKDKILSSIISQLDYKNFDKVDIVIEAVFEDLQLKQDVLQKVEAIVPEHCIFASNTSALPISKLAAISKRPEKVIGMHYFSPVDKMQLLEIVKTPLTSKDTIASAVEVGLKQKKVIIVVADGPGFYTTRLFASIVSEMQRLLQEGEDPNKLNNLFTSFGFPVGCCSLVDEIGLDVATHVARDLYDTLGARLTVGFPDAFMDLIGTGSLGRKTGKGIFLYDGESKDRRINPTFQDIMKRFRLEPKAIHNDEDLTLRMVTRFVNEVVLCLQEDIVSRPLEADVGAVFGLGFPPFTGGPLHYIDRVGADWVVEKMRKYEDWYGETFTPCQILLDHANDTSKKFFPSK